MTNPTEDPDEVVADDKVLRSWGAQTPVEISLRIEGDAMLETLAVLTGYDFRLPLCEQQIPRRGQE